MLLIVLSRLPKKERPKEGAFLFGLRVALLVLVVIFVVMITPHLLAT